MIRPRDKANGLLPPNLYRKLDKRTGRTYYNYRDPRNGKWHGLGIDHETAINDAIALNAAILASIRSLRIAAMIKPVADAVTLNRLGLRHLELCEKRELAVNTIRSRKSNVNAWIKALGKDKPIDQIKVTELVEVIASYEARGQNRSALAMRTTAVEMWKDAMAEGWVNENIAERTRAPSAKVMRSRLTLDDFKLIYEKAGQLDPWIRHAMALAITTAQRREDIAAFEFRPSGNATSWLDGTELYVIQQKTGNRVCIPIGLGVAGFTLAESIKACRDAVISRWMVHHQKPRTKSRPGDQVWVDTITRGFARARDLAGIKGEPGKTPPTFHEIRSLAIRLYTSAYGKDFAQAIAGHKDAATTDLYRDTRGAEWIRVSAA